MGAEESDEIRGQFTYIVVPDRKRDSETRPTTLVSRILRDCGPLEQSEVDM